MGHTMLHNLHASRDGEIRKGISYTDGARV